MYSDEQNKTEKATPYKLREARKKGQVAKSQDLNASAIFFASFFALYFFGDSIIRDSSNYFARTLTMSSQIHITLNSMQGILENIVYQVAVIMWPFVLCILITAIIVNFAQIGPVFSLFSLKANPKRLNPVEGAKKIFSKRTLVELVKTFVRFMMVLSISLVLYYSFAPDWYGAMNISPKLYPSILLQQVLYLVGSIAITYLFLAIMDFVFVKWDYMKRMMMSRRDLREEYKHREGDPDIKAKRRELQKSYISTSKSFANVSDADVVVTNPTHIAVAIRYKRESMMAPVIVAKGKGFIAKYIKHLARKHAVPVVENKILARELVQCELNTYVPQSVYSDIAKILADIIRRKQAVRI